MLYLKILMNFKNPSATMYVNSETIRVGPIVVVTIRAAFWIMLECFDKYFKFLNGNIAIRLNGYNAHLQV